MRNLIEHPVTHGEIILCLEDIEYELPVHGVGDMTPILLQMAIEIVRQHHSDGKKVPGP